MKFLLKFLLVVMVAIIVSLVFVVNRLQPDLMFITEEYVLLFAPLLLILLLVFWISRAQREDVLLDRMFWIAQLQILMRRSLYLIPLIIVLGLWIFGPLSRWRVFLYNDQLKDLDHSIQWTNLATFNRDECKKLLHAELAKQRKKILIAENREILLQSGFCGKSCSRTAMNYLDMKCWEKFEK